jgi:hypothetical protein
MINSSFTDELLKIAKEQAQAGAKRKGVGSRGGRVVGHTKSGRPIYASSRKKSKSKGMSFGQKATIGAGVAAAAGLGALAVHDVRKANKAWKAAKRSYESASHSGGGGGSRSYTGGTGGSSGGSGYSSPFGGSSGGSGYSSPFGGSAGSSTGSRPFGGSAGSSTGSRHDRQHSAWKKANKAYERAGGYGGMERGKKASKAQWDAYKKAGDDFFSSSDTRRSWENIKDYDRKAYRAYNDFHKASGRAGSRSSGSSSWDYAGNARSRSGAGGSSSRSRSGAGGSSSRSSSTGAGGSSSRSSSTGGGGSSSSSRSRPREEPRRARPSSSGPSYSEPDPGHEARNAARTAARRRTRYAPHSGSRHEGAKDPHASSTYRYKTKDVHSAIPGMGAAKKKTEATAAYRKAAMGAHPDRHGGKSDKFNRVQKMWEHFQNSGDFSKLAHMLFWGR